MSTHEDLPLGTRERTEIISDIVATKALELWSKGIDFVDIPDTPEFKEATAGLFSKDLQEVAETIASDDIKARKDATEKRVESLMNQRLSEEAARRQVRGKTLEAFVKNRIEKITIDLEEE